MMEKFFYPKSVAVIGASREERKIGFVLLKNLKEKFKGKVYPVNPNAKEILGLKSFPSVLNIDDEIDLAIVAVKASIVPSILEECGKKGIKNVLIISAGFSESGEEGKKLEKELVEIAKENKIRIVGPNTIGIYNPEVNLDATFFLDSDVEKPKEGNVSFFSQSGTIAVLAMENFSKNGIGVSKVVSYGNGCDINECDLIEYFSKDEKTKVIAGFIEGIKDGKRFLEVIKKCKKPIILLKGGKTETGARAVASHTSSMAGDYKVFSNVMKQFGVIEANTWEELIDLVKIFSNLEKVSGKNLAIITNAGGFGVLASDEAEKNGIKLKEPSEKLKEELRKVLPSYASLRNPIDIIADADSERYRNVFKIMEKYKEFDIYLIIVLVQVPSIDENIVEAILSFKKPKVVVISGKKAKTIYERMIENKIPVFESPERAIKAISKFLSVSFSN